MKTFILGILSCMIPWLSLMAKDPTVLTVDTLFSIPRLSQLALSPDGKCLAFRVTTFQEETHEKNQRIWVYSFETRQARPWTEPSSSAFQPRWSSDSQYLYFLSGKDGSIQVYRLSIQGGEREKITDLPVTIVDFWLFPKDSRLLLNVLADPSCQDDLACYETLEEKDSPKILTHLLYRHWNQWLSQKIPHLWVYDPATQKVEDLTPGDDPVPPVSLNGPTTVAISPDGRFLAYATLSDPHPERSTNHDIFLYDFQTEERQNITTSNPALDTGPVFSPDGTVLAYLSAKRPGYESDQLDLLLYHLQSKKTINLTQKFDRSVEDFVFAPDGRSLFFIAGDWGYRELFRVRVQTQKVEKLSKKKTCHELAISSEGDYLVTLIENHALPKEIFRYAPIGSTFQRLTFLTEPALQGVSWGSLEEVTWKSYDGIPIHGFLLKPPHFNPKKKYPLVVLIHGGPQGAFEDEFHYRWNLEMFAAPGYLVFAPNFRGSSGYGLAFKEAVSRDWGGKPYEDIMSGVDYLIKHYPYVDKSRIAAAGASYGGFMVNWIATQTDRFRCLISHAGVFDQFSMYGTTEELWFPEWEFGGDPYHHPELYRRFSPSLYVDRIKTPMLILHGAKDFRVPMNQTMQLFTALQRLGVPSRYVLFMDEDHFVRKPANAKIWWEEVYSWLAKYLKEPEKPHHPK